MNQVAEKPKESRAIAVWQDFEAEIKERENAIVSMLPQHVSKDRFLNSAIAAVKQTPELLTCTPRSLFAAITKSAQDGLLPDGREGVVTFYNEKQKDGSYERTAQWNPMAWGLRKRARELDGIIISTSVVHENDHFEQDEGDDPHIVHKPAQLGTARGEMIGAYAIFRRDGEILHREVMDKAQIAAVRAQSKAANSLMWTKFASEGWRKTVLRRGIKSVPCSEKLETIVTRDDDLFDFAGDPPTDRIKPQLVAPPPQEMEAPQLVAPETEATAPDARVPSTVNEERAPMTEKPEAENAEEGAADPDAWLDGLEDAFSACAAQGDLSEAWETMAQPRIDEGMCFPPDIDKAKQLHQKHAKRLA